MPLLRATFAAADEELRTDDLPSALLTSTDGTRVEADVTMGADGVHSYGSRPGHRTFTGGLLPDKSFGLTDRRSPVAEKLSC
ncbi:hypothetical protein ACVWWN_000234 [Mycobacterium sp. URHB0021]